MLFLFFLLLIVILQILLGYCCTNYQSKVFSDDFIAQKRNGRRTANLLTFIKNSEPYY